MHSPRVVICPTRYNFPNHFCKFPQVLVYYIHFPVNLASQKFLKVNYYLILQHIYVHNKFLQ